MRNIFFMSIFICFITVTNSFGQCIHLYQCKNCGQNSRGTSSPSSGNYCSGAAKYGGHRWYDQGMDDPECERQIAERKEREAKAAAEYRRECERKSIKYYKEGWEVVVNYCPSGKIKEVNKGNEFIIFREDGTHESSFINGILSYYNQDGTLKESGKAYYGAEGKYDRNTHTFILGSGYNAYRKEGNWNGTEYRYGINVSKFYQEHYDRCNTQSCYAEFLSEYPNAPKSLINKAIEKEKELNALNDKKYWERIVNQWMSSSYKDYLNLFRNGAFISEAKIRLKECNIWESAHYTNTIESYQNYLNTYPNGHFKLKALSYIDDRYFDKALEKEDQELFDSKDPSKGNPPSEEAYILYEEYLKLYPNGNHTSFAICRIDLYKAHLIKINKSNRTQKRIDAYQISNKCDYSERIKNLQYIHKFQTQLEKPNLLLNLIVPGIGHANLNKTGYFGSIHGEKDGGQAFSSTIFTYGLVGGGIALKILGKNTYNNYLNDSNPANWGGDLKKSQNLEKWGNGFLIAGVSYYIIDNIRLVYKIKEAKKMVESAKQDKHLVYLNIYPNISNMGATISLKF